MKKKVFTAIFFLLFIVTKIYAQDNSLAFEKTNSTISAGYGFFNVWTNLLEVGQLKATATGPVTLTYEYGITNKISAGLTVGYSDINGNGDAAGFTQQLTNYLIEAKASYHFYVSHKLDSYVGGGIGYYHFKYTDSYGDETQFILPSLLALSIDVGAKYYFCDHFGICVEAGYVDGSIVKTALTYKL